MTIPVAVVGVGTMGANHARVYSSTPSAKLVAVVDSNHETGTSVAIRDKCNFYSTVTDLLNNETIKAASVAVPTSTHAKVAAQLLANGIHTLIEKPLATSVTECLDLCSLAAKSGALVMVGHIERFNPAIRKLKTLIKDGIFGEITSLITRRVGLAPPRIRDVDVVTDLAVHDIDIANFLLDALPTEIYSNSGFGKLADRIDFSEIFLIYGKANAIISVNWLTPLKIRKLSITGTLGYGELDLVRQEFLLYQAPESNTFDDFSDFINKYGHDRADRVSVEFAEPLTLEIDHFLDCVQRRKTPEIGCQEAINVLKTVENIINRSKITCYGP